MSAFANAVDFFAPDLASDTPEARRRVRLIVQISLIITACAPPYSLVYAKVGYTFGVVAILIAASTILPNLFLLRRRRQRGAEGTALAASVLLSSLFGVLTVLALGTGGPVSSSAAWFGVVPLIALLLIGPRAATGWAVTSLAVILGMFGWGATGHEIAQHIPAADLAQTMAISWVGLTLVVLFVARAFHGGLTEALAGLAAAQAQAEADADAMRAMADEQRALRESVEQKVEDAVRESEAQRADLAASVDRMLAEMQRFADGDLTARIDETRDDVIGELYAGFDRAVGNVRQMLERVRTSFDAAALAADDIGRSSEHLDGSAREQSAHTQEVAAAMEEMVQTIETNARTADEAARTAERSGTSAQSGHDVVDRTIEKIRAIAEVVSESSATVERLGESSEQIGQIIGTIDEIADQTNLLALNAAIEAARAGEHGQGFAVVAGEVRKLAERTTAATSQVAETIARVQQETAAAVVAMQRGTAEVDEGLRLSDEAGASLRQIVEEAQRTVDLVAQIATATDEQSRTSNDIARSIATISDVTRESSDAVHRVAEASDRMRTEAGEARALLGHFQTGSDPVAALGVPGVARAGA